MSKEQSQIAIQNRLPVPIHYAAFERESLALINWVPICLGANEVRPYQTASIPITDESFRPSNQAVVYWWKRCVQDQGSGLAIGQELESVVVTVR